jgi:hypothetical protein
MRLAKLRHRSAPRVVALVLPLAAGLYRCVPVLLGLIKGAAGRPRRNGVVDPRTGYFTW